MIKGQSATIADFDKWLSELAGHYGSYDQKVFVTQDETDEVGRVKSVRVCTSRNTYSITVREKGSHDGYLGAIVTSRLARAGENWLRGNDLTDGPLCRATWDRIMFDIISYELVPIKADKQAALTAT